MGMKMMVFAQDTNCSQKAYLLTSTLALQKAVLSPSSSCSALLLKLLKEKPQSAKFALLRSDKSQYGHDLRQGREEVYLTPPMTLDALAQNKSLPE